MTSEPSPGRRSASGSMRRRAKVHIFNILLLLRGQRPRMYVYVICLNDVAAAAAAAQDALHAVQAFSAPSRDTGVWEFLA